MTHGATVRGRLTSDARLVMIVTIDGPAGAGKSTTAKALAQRLGFRFLDTGAMYRMVALAALERRTSWVDPKALAELAAGISIELVGGRVLLDGRDVTDRIRQGDVTSVVHRVADNAEVRRRLVELQRRAGAAGDVVTEGRDQGTLAFPGAQCKFFLMASARERARRRLGQMRERGERGSLSDVLAQQNERDRRDEARPLGRLVPAKDAVVIVADNLTLEQVVDRLESLVREKQAERG